MTTLPQIRLLPPLESKRRFVVEFQHAQAIVRAVQDELPDFEFAGALKIYSRNRMKIDVLSQREFTRRALEAAAAIVDDLGEKTLIFLKAQSKVAAACRRLEDPLRAGQIHNSGLQKRQGL